MFWINANVVVNSNGSAAIDRYFLPTGRSAANLSDAAAAVDRWDIQTYGWTDGHSSVT